jgi:hypothetical protein
MTLVSLREKIAQRVELGGARKCLPESIHFSVLMQKVMKLVAYNN